MHVFVENEWWVLSLPYEYVWHVRTFPCLCDFSMILLILYDFMMLAVFVDLPCLSFVNVAHHRYHHQHPHHHPPNHGLGSLATCFCPRSCRLGISASTTLPSRCSGGTVDGRNHAPPDTHETLQTMGHYQLVQDIFHQQYVGKQRPLQIHISINKTFLV